MLTTTTPVLKDLFGKPGRLWLIGATYGDMSSGNLSKLLGKIETLEQHSDLTPVILSFRSPNAPMMEIDTSIKTIRCTLMQQSTASDYESALRSFIDEVVSSGHKVVAVIIEDFDKTYTVDRSNASDYRYLLRRLTFMTLKENFVCIVHAPLAHEAKRLKTSVGYEFLKLIPLNGYFDYSRNLEQEAHSVVYYSIDERIVHFIMGKHRSHNGVMDCSIISL